MLPVTFADRFGSRVEGGADQRERTVAEAQERCAGLQGRATIVQNHLANVTAAETARTTAKATRRGDPQDNQRHSERRPQATAKKPARLRRYGEEAKLRQRKRR